jgi:hypothetical protein
MTDDVVRQKYALWKDLVVDESRGFQHRDGTPFTPDERRLLDSTTRQEVQTFAAWATHDYDQVDAEIGVAEELEAFLEPVWSQYPGLKLKDMVQRLPEPDKTRAKQLIEAMEAEETIE